MPTCHGAARCPSRSLRRWSTRSPPIRIGASELDRPAARRSSALRPARRGDDRPDARLGPARPGARRGVGRSARLRARRARHRRRSLSGRGRGARAALLPAPAAALAPFVMRALANIRYRDEPVSFENYGEYAVVGHRHERRARTARDAGVARPARARRSPELEALRAHGGLAGKLRSMSSGRAGDPRRRSERCARRCRGMRHRLVLRRACSWPPDVLRSAAGDRVDRLRGPRRRADHLQGILPRAALHRRLLLHALRQPAEVLADGHEARAGSAAAGGAGLADQIRTAAITYDPAFDLARTSSRLWAGPRRANGRRPSNAAGDRRQRRAARALRARRQLHRVAGEPPSHRGLHPRCAGRIAASFERIHWDEQEVVAKAVEVLRTRGAELPMTQEPRQPEIRPRRARYRGCRCCARCGRRCR